MTRRVIYVFFTESNTQWLPYKFHGHSIRGEGILLANMALGRAREREREKEIKKERERERERERKRESELREKERQ
jgi:hypothetical protein